MSFMIDHHVEFVHVPKAAGMWIESCCKPHIELLGSRHDLGKHTVLPSFAVARAPYPWFCSAKNYTQKTIDTLAGKNAKGWFQNSPFAKIGSLSSLKVKDITLEEVIQQYLKEMPGKYSKAALEYYNSVDRLVDMMYLRESFIDVVTKFRVPQRKPIISRAEMLKPVNTSPGAGIHPNNSGLIDLLIEAEHAYYSHVCKRGVTHD